MISFSSPRRSVRLSGRTVKKGAKLTAGQAYSRRCSVPLDEPMEGWVAANEEWWLKRRGRNPAKDGINIAWCNLVSPENFFPVLISVYPIPIIPSAGLANRTNSVNLREKLTEYVENGGNLIVMTRLGSER